MTYPLVFQKDFNDCGPACIYTLCKYYNIPYNQRTILSLAKLTPTGTSIWNMHIALESLGFSCEAKQVSDMSLLGIAKEIFAHACCYYGASAIKALGVDSDAVDDCSEA